jgi:hypothetical protein
MRWISYVKFPRKASVNSDFLILSRCNAIMDPALGEAVRSG